MIRKSKDFFLKVALMIVQLICFFYVCFKCSLYFDVNQKNICGKEKIKFCSKGNGYEKHFFCPLIRHCKLDTTTWSIQQKELAVPGTSCTINMRSRDKLLLSNWTQALS